MSPQQTALIKKSWRVLRQTDPLLLGGLFYDKLFLDDPSLRRMFKSSMEEQAQKLIDMLSAIVVHLDKMDTITADIVALAIRHVKYGVMPEHYAAVGSALLWTLSQGLGADWTPEMEEAWTACYTHLATAMMEATTS